MNSELKPTYLYHYTKVETAIEKIFPFFELKMFPLSQMNDPQENLLHEVEPYNYIDDLYHNPCIIGRLPIASLIRSKTLISSFCIDKCIDNNGSKATLEGYLFQRMWSQYGGSNTGVCLVINYNKFIEENAKLLAQYNIIDAKVVYHNQHYIDMPTQLFGRSEESCKNEQNTPADFWNMLKKDKRFIQNRLLTKDSDWESESEYRFLAFKQNNEDIVFSIRESLEAVYLGVHFSRHYLPSIKQQVAQEKIKALGLLNGKYRTKQISFD